MVNGDATSAVFDIGVMWPELCHIFAMFAIMSAL